ncbi:MAG: hypothetical protein V4665_02610 [Patescibacteria group bacterium]
MGQIRRSEYKEIKKMYTEGSTMADIAQHLNVSLNAIVYAMRKANIPRRSMKEMQELRFKRKPVSFTIRNGKTVKKRNIIIAGVLLYWAEGYKTSKASGVDFANSDPEMIAIFMKFLRTCYSLDEKRLRILLYCYSDQNISQLIGFWSTQASIPKNQFSKPYIRENKSISGRKMPYGLVHIRYSDKKLLFDILERIGKLKKELRVGTQVVNEGRL